MLSKSVCRPRRVRKNDVIGNPTLMRLAELSVACDIGTLLFFGSWLWLMLRRRDLWLRYTAAEEALWKRLHLPPRSRRFGQGRGILFFAKFSIALSLILLIASVGLCIHIQRHPQPNKSPQPARGGALIQDSSH